jgi:hypothetical protein
MNEFEDRSSNPDCIYHESILAQKVFDQCRVKKCIELGPAISAEKCTCFIVPSDEDDNPGRVILPDKPIYLPESVSIVKIIYDSFKTEKIQITDVAPSAYKKGYWDIEIIITFLFDAELYDSGMKKFKILCCPSDCKSLSDCKKCEDHIKCSVKHACTVTLFGSTINSDVAYSASIGKNANKEDNIPQVLAEAKTYPVKAYIKYSDDSCGLEEILDGIYDEPIIYIFIEVRTYIIVKLFRLVNIIADSCGYDLADPCNEISESPCDVFDKMQFPDNQFFPDQRS